MIDFNEKEYKKFKAILIKEGANYKSEGEYKEAYSNFLRFAELLYELAKEQNCWELRLKDEPKGFKMDSNGRTCSVCKKNIVGEIWFDGELKCNDCY